MARLAILVGNRHPARARGPGLALLAALVLGPRWPPRITTDRKRGTTLGPRWSARNAACRFPRGRAGPGKGSYRAIQSTPRRAYRVPALSLSALRPAVIENRKCQGARGGRLLAPLPRLAACGSTARAWLRHLASQGRWTEFLEVYEAGEDAAQPGGDAAQRCRWLTAQFETGDRDRALDLVAPVWLVGRSQPDACDPVFERWIAAGRLSSALVWERVRWRWPPVSRGLQPIWHAFSTRRTVDW